MIIDCISDLHGYQIKLEGGDLLLIAGDLTARDKPHEFDVFKKWLREQPYTKKVLIAGNHDNFLARLEKPEEYFDEAVYLCDTGTDFQGLKIWGSPWTKNFHGQNPLCKAFGLDLSTQMLEKFELIPDDIDILITHSPPQGILDQTWRMRVGCPELRRIVQKLPNLKLHLFGHIHEGYGEEEEARVKFVNASLVNESYQLVNKPVIVIL